MFSSGRTQQRIYSNMIILIWLEIHSSQALCPELVWVWTQLLSPIRDEWSCLITNIKIAFYCTVTTSDTMCAAPVFNCGQDQVWQVLHQLFVPPSATLAFDRWKNVQKIRNYFSKNMSRNNFTLNLSVAIFISCWWVIAGVRRGVCSSGSCRILRES